MDYNKIGPEGAKALAELLKINQVCQRNIRSVQNLTNLFQL